MRRLTARLRRPLSYLLLPLSAIPLVAIVPLVQAAHKTFQREHDSAPLTAPPLELTKAQREAWQPVPSYRDAVPVLAYHGVSDADVRGTVTRAAFTQQMALVRQMGYRAISIDQYADWRAGRAELPERPILITFDGAWLDTYRGADAVLARYGLRATIFVRTAAIGAGDPEQLTWRELKAMQRSQRWDVESQGHDSRGRVVVDPSGRTAPFYAARRFTRSAGHETLASFERRVTTDVFAAKDELEHQGLPVRAIALPDGDRGPDAIADASIAPLVSGLLERQFDVVFVAPVGTPGYTTRVGAVERYEIVSSTTVEALRAWLRAQSPAALAIRARDARREARRERAERGAAR